MGPNDNTRKRRAVENVICEENVPKVLIGPSTGCSKQDMKIEDDKDKILRELVGALMDFCVTVFHSILYNATNYSRELFIFSEMFGVEVPICQHPKIAEYIEICSKKLVAFWSSDMLDGFQFKLLKHTITTHRFVFSTLNGKFNVENLNQKTLDSILKDIAERTQQLLTEIGRNEDIKNIRERNVSKRSKFRIVLGLNDETRKLYDTFQHGPFTNDTDLETFPWSMPKKPLLNNAAPSPLTAIIIKENADSNTVIQQSSKENSLSPQKARKCGGFSSPPQAMDSKTNILNSLIQEIVPIIEKSESTLVDSPMSTCSSPTVTAIAIKPEIGLFDISAFDLGNSMNVTIYVQYTKHYMKDNLNSRGRVVELNGHFDSPGVYKKNGVEITSTSPLWQRRLQLLSPIRTSPIRIQRGSPLGGSPNGFRIVTTNGSPTIFGVPIQTSSVSVSPRRFLDQQKPKSARSLKQAFDTSASIESRGQRIAKLGRTQNKATRQHV